MGKHTERLNVTKQVQSLGKKRAVMRERLSSEEI